MRRRAKHRTWTAPCSCPLCAAVSRPPARRAAFDLWILAGLLLLAPLATGWLRFALFPPRLAAATAGAAGEGPVRLDSMRRLLAGARTVVPPGATYTVRAADPDAAMALWMLSLGILTDRQGRPALYYGTPLPALAGEATFVVDYGCEGAATAGLERVARFPAGCVERRSRAPGGGG